MPTARPRLSIALSRRAIACATCLGAVAVGLPGCSDSTSPPVLIVSAVAATDGQTARTGTPLPRPLAVLVVSDGAPKTGVTVTWQASAGTVPSSSITDAGGLASATWTLGAEPGAMTVSTGVAGAEGSPVTFNATALAPPLTAVPSGNGQTGVVGTVLPLPLRVKVLSEDGTPKEGVIVHWQAQAGSLAPTENTSDSAGFAETTWTLDTVAGIFTTYATIAGAEPATVSFNASALPGAAVAIAAASGSGQTYPANHPPSNPLVAVVTDQYGNRIAGQAVTWAVKSGPATILQTGGATDAAGRSITVIGPSEAAGSAVVRAALSGAGASTDFALTVAPPTFEVVLHTNGAYSFVSSQNLSRSPAVDTIPAGRTITWTLEFDYDLHGVAPVGTPTFQGGDFPYADPSIVSVTFATPGTYHYADPYFPSATGIVVVQ